MVNGLPFHMFRLLNHSVSTLQADACCLVPLTCKNSSQAALVQNNSE